MEARFFSNEDGAGWVDGGVAIIWLTNFVSRAVSFQSACSERGVRASAKTAKSVIFLRGIVAPILFAGRFQIGMARATSTSVVLNSLTSWRSTWGRVQAGEQRRATFAAFLFVHGFGFVTKGRASS